MKIKAYVSSFMEIDLCFSNLFSTLKSGKMQIYIFIFYLSTLYLLVYRKEELSFYSKVQCDIIVQCRQVIFIG